MAIGTSWETGSWEDAAWEDGSWADAGAPGGIGGPVGSVWAEDSWSDTAWIEDTWADRADQWGDYGDPAEYGGNLGLLGPFGLPRKPKYRIVGDKDLTQDQMDILKFIITITTSGRIL